MDLPVLQFLEVGEKVYYTNTRELGIVTEVINDAFVMIAFGPLPSEKIAICNLSR